MKSYKVYWVVSLFFLIGLISACSGEVKDYAPDISQISLAEFTFERFDKAVGQMDTNDIILAYKKLSDKQPYLTDLYFKRLISLPFENQDSFYFYIRDFVSAQPIRELHSKVDETFRKDDKIIADLQKACKYLSFYFPEKRQPSFYTFITEFGYQNIIFSDGERDGVGIGLDFFLGDEYDYKSLDPRNPAFSDYITRTYNKDHLVKKAVEVWVNDMIGGASGKRFVDQMIHNGKSLYIMDKVLPFLPDSVVFEYTEDQMDWLNSNEIEMWSFFLDNELMYQTDQRQILKYLNPAPHSPGMPPQAPGRTANYIGYKIVDSYMNRNQDNSLQDLIEMQDAQKLMELSKYKPRRR